MSDEYIRKADAIKQCGFGMTSLLIADNLRRMPPADVVSISDLLQAGYEGKELRFHINGRLFAIRELAQ